MLIKLYCVTNMFLVTSRQNVPKGLNTIMDIGFPVCYYIGAQYICVTPFSNSPSHNFFSSFFVTLTSLSKFGDQKVDEILDNLKAGLNFGIDYVKTFQCI